MHEFYNSSLKFDQKELSHLSDTVYENLNYAVSKLCMNSHEAKITIQFYIEYCKTKQGKERKKFAIDFTESGVLDNLFMLKFAN